MRYGLLWALTMPVFCASAGNNYGLPSAASLYAKQGLFVDDCPSVVITDSGVDYPSPDKRRSKAFSKQAAVRPYSMVFDDCPHLRLCLQCPIKPGFYFEDTDPTFNDYSFGDQLSDDEEFERGEILHEMLKVAAAIDVLIAPARKKSVQTASPLNLSTSHKSRTHKASWMRRLSDAFCSVKNITKKGSIHV